MPLDTRSHSNQEVVNETAGETILDLMAHYRRRISGFATFKSIKVFSYLGMSKDGYNVQLAGSSRLAVIRQGGCSINRPSHLSCKRSPNVRDHRM